MKSLAVLFDQIKNAGHVPQAELVLVEMDKALKEKHLHHHNERIAVAFSPISMPIGKPIIVKKNLICADCRSVIKFMSKVIGRIVIVRDSSRFHYFVNGSCSGKDYW
ncbi:pentatricopeptide repeat-containing protein DWY1, chloroplastic-like [Neltuma alba]|uniref:pentatricopeptide repeat-containing protein DWY1, chloroplastic-like n=1 Tax=Neltuma alba TaxID=207710 RepID=UPI0010A4911A|nr:pentatricopeptide repeat-containing protein DWY1, chloroplastic-like [Prosopis alba]XP_028795568.1 pentatricopeptide repeat-containing protein DWY1, chloroplastic-like [Prosopis alba]